MRDWVAHAAACAKVEERRRAAKPRVAAIQSREDGVVSMVRVDVELERGIQRGRSSRCGVLYGCSVKHVQSRRTFEVEHGPVRVGESINDARCRRADTTSAFSVVTCLSLWSPCAPLRIIRGYARETAPGGGFISSLSPCAGTRMSASELVRLRATAARCQRQAPGTLATSGGPAD